MKRLIPVIHLVNDNQVFTNIETCLKEGINHVFLINHITNHTDLLRVALKVKEKYPTLWIGLNFLDLHPKDVLKLDLEFDAIWVDKTLTIEDIENKSFKGEIFSGLNFKYQKQFYGEDLVKAIDIIKKTSTVACTSGAGTGIAANANKIKDLKDLLADFPLGLASGVSAENIEAYLPYVDNFLVASSITDRNEYIQAKLLKELILKIS